MSFTPSFTPTAEKLLPDLTPREELVLLARTLWREGYNDHLAGHITINCGDGTLWCNPWLMTWDEIRPRDVIRIDLDGNVVEGDWPVPLGIPLHLELHRARPDATAIAHAHTRFGRAWSATGKPLEPLSQDACAFHDDLSIFDEYSGVVYDTDEGGALARALGPNKAVLLRHHGILTVGETVDEAAFWLHLLERCCEAQLLVAALVRGPDGSPAYDTLTPEVAAHTRAQVGEPIHGWMGFQPLYEEIVRADPGVLT